MSGLEPRVRVVQELQVEALPRGVVHRLLLDLAEDGLGLPLRIPVLVARGRKEGPVFGFTAALHGNELNGIPIIHRLMSRVDCATLRGTLVAVVAINAPGLHMHQRAFNDGQDLNRLFPGREDGNEGQVWASRFMERVVRQLDYLVDLHTASRGRHNCLYVRANMEQATTARMALLQRPQIIVHNPAPDETLRGAAMELGIPAITLEVGNPHRFQRNLIRSSLAGLRNVLADLRMIPRRPPPSVDAPVVCGHSYWLYTDRGGLLEVLPSVAGEVRQGEPIARLHDAFGDLVREYAAPEDGVVIGKNVDPVAQTGARILHLGIPGDLPAPKEEP